MNLLHGHEYVAAGDLPWYASHSMLRDGLHEYGFTHIEIWDADDPHAPDVGTRKSHNVIVRAVYAGDDMTADLPEEVVWIADVTPEPAVTPAVTPSQPESPWIFVQRPLTPEELRPTPDRSWIVAALALAGGYLWIRRAA